MNKKISVLLLVLLLAPTVSLGQTNSIARIWNNLVLESIRNDFARPTVHARNLYHHSIIAYDGWAAYAPSQTRFFLGDTLDGYVCAYDSISIPADIAAARHMTISYASYRFIQNRYANSPDYPATKSLIDNQMFQFGYDTSITSTDYINGGPAELGNYLAEQIQLYGYTDGSNELNDFENIYYDQLNPPLEVALPGNPDIQDPNHWQPLALETLIDQSGNVITTNQPHLSPEWGDVYPFSLKPQMANQLTRNGDTYNVYFDSLHPALLEVGDSSAWESFYKWNHSLVSVWQSHLDTNDGVMWDISPASLGNNTWYPSDSTEFPLFYDLTNGGDPGVGYTVNPITGQPYTPQIVHRADYARVLAEFWADGIDSETPPGHWFEIYHYVSDQPTFERKWKGIGPILDTLEFDVKAQLTLGGTMHDAAICAWSLKGYYDYLRPVSAIRYMADQGQSSDTNELNYDPNGIPLLTGFIEVVQIGDTLAGQWNENVGKIKLFTWKGHDYINNPLTDAAGVGWILAEDWWPYQRPTFVTPPFAGFVSGHSTFSRAAAHTMEFITGSSFFPGGMGEFVAPMNEFLQFEEGPSDTIRLQWATYIDASDQCSLSRIWGGIHPPIDDIPGRMIGDVVGPMASLFADSIFSFVHPALIATTCSDPLINFSDIGNQFTIDFEFNVAMDSSIMANLTLLTPMLSSAIAINGIDWIDSFNLQVSFDVLTSSIEILETAILLQNVKTASGLTLPNYVLNNQFIVDTKKPLLISLQSNYSTLNDAVTTQNLILTVIFDETCDTSLMPSFLFTGTNYINPTLSLNPLLSEWTDDSTYTAYFSSIDFDELVDSISIDLTNINDSRANMMDNASVASPFNIDTENPTMLTVTPDDTLINQADLLNPLVTFSIIFSEAMNTNIIPNAYLENQGTNSSSLIQSTIQTVWIDSNELAVPFLIVADNNDLISLDLNLMNVSDAKGNDLTNGFQSSVIWSDMKSPEVVNQVANKPIISDSLAGSANYFIDITFSEPMDTTVSPLVMHNASQGISGSIQYNLPASQFLDSFNYRAVYQIIDEGIEVSPISLKVQYAKDFAGNSQLIATIPNFISLDTKNPSINSIYANDYILDQWGQSFEILAIYDEPMRSDIDPSVTFTPLVPVTFPQVNSNWSNNLNYTVDYQLQGSPPQVTIFDLLMNGAVDIAGNLQNELSLSEFFEIHPILGLSELNGNNALIYPSIFNSGASLNIIGSSAEINLTYDCIDAMGQSVKTIQFTKENDKYISEPIFLAPGMYYLNNGSQQFKIIVL